MKKKKIKKNNRVMDKFVMERLDRDQPVLYVTVKEKEKFVATNKHLKQQKYEGGDVAWHER